MWIVLLTYDHTAPSIRVAFTDPTEPVVDKVGWADNTVRIDAIKPKKGVADADLTGTVGFHGVPEEVWNFHIRGYLVCAKWLKERGKDTRRLAGGIFGR